jgi:chaperonin GroEL
MGWKSEPILHGEAVRQKMLRGVNKLANAVVVTLGPCGRTVCIQKSYGSPLITKDGVSVAKEVELYDPYENMGALMVREASSKTSDDAGDGTTTATVLARAMIVEGLKLVAAGHAPISLKRGMDRALEEILGCIDFFSHSVEGQGDVEAIATQSANGDTVVGKIVAEAVMKVGKDGVINIEEGKGMTTYLEATDGMRIDRGHINPMFALEEATRETVFSNALVLVTDHSISNIRPLLPLLEAVAEAQRPLVLIAPDFEKEALSVLYQNHARKVIVSAPIKAPSFGMQQTEILRDLASLTGAQFVTREQGMSLMDATFEMLGSAEIVTITDKHTTIVGGGGTEEALEERMSMIRAQIDSSGSEFDREKLQERLGKLLGGICSIKVGASSELELRELKGRLEDALHATRAALDEGLVPGGGVCLAKASRMALIEDDLNVPEEEMPGYRLACEACLEPFYAILRNAGVKHPDGYLDEVLSNDNALMGVNARTLEFVNMKDEGILDPTKVVRSAVTNAVSVAGTLLTTEAGIHKKSQD